MDYKGVIVGLGNPGAKYDHTRHNCGFDFVSFLVELANRKTFDGEAIKQYIDVHPEGQIVLMNYEQHLRVMGEQIRINPKNMAAYWEANHVNMVFLSNEAMPVVLEDDDRRHAVIWTPEQLDRDF